MTLSFLADEDGATAIEYALVAAMVGIIAMAALASFGNAVSSKFSFIASSVTAAGT